MLFTQKKIFEKIHLWKEESKKIVFANGCFDLLHKGHKDLLSKAKKYGDILIVGLNSDSSVKKLKGENRPIQNEIIRAKNLSKLDYVNAVCIFNQNTPIELIKSIRPNFLVKGNDYLKEDVIGNKIIGKWGGEIILIPITKGYSTTLIIKNKIEGLV